ncbi:hypothetical protein [Adonisia turfae]|uniref:hypothetical protein n=1 Tax=Adonisia turfae TaxID=2950184 RepID=UPI0013D37671|nr:hypothetical protein [Adonisia turfae]
MHQCSYPYLLSYDAANRLTTFISRDGTATYTYDDRDQLTGADYTAQDNEAYTYDANGNRTNAGYQTGTNNQLTTDGVFNYKYDNEIALIVILAVAMAR